MTLTLAIQDIVVAGKPFAVSIRTDKNVNATLGVKIGGTPIAFCVSDKKSNNEQTITVESFRVNLFTVHDYAGTPSSGQELEVIVSSETATSSKKARFR